LPKFLSRLASVLLLLASLVGNGVSAEDALTPHFAVYKVKIGVLRGQMKSQLRYDHGAYASESVVRPTGIARIVSRGLIVENSNFTVADGRVRAATYTGLDTLSKNGQDVSLVFNWAGGEVDGVADELQFDRPLVSGTVDRASLQYALMADLSSDRLRSEYVLQDVGETKVLSVTSAGSKDVKVPFGEFSVVGFLPVIIEQYRDGKLTGQVLLSEYSTPAG
jgi:hypothetical protein